MTKKHTRTQGSLLEIRVSKLPVDQGPPSLNVFATVILVINVVGMLPNIAGEDGDTCSLSQRRPCIMSLDDLKFVGRRILNHPGPS